MERNIRGGTIYNKFVFELRHPISLNPNATTTFICGNNGDLIGIRKNSQDLHLYNYDFKVFEEKYNVITIQNGMAGLMIQN